MIWLGNAVPGYALESARLFRLKYPKYDFNFIRYSIDKIRKVCEDGSKTDIDNALYGACRDAFYSRGFYSEYIKNQKRIYGSRMKNVMLLSDLFRLELLNLFGGIYIDVDSVPGAAFDENIMSRNRFCVSRKYGEKIAPDNYFMG